MDNRTQEYQDSNPDHQHLKLPSVIKQEITLSCKEHRNLLCHETLVQKNSFLAKRLRLK